MRLSGRLIIAGLAVFIGGSLAGCSASPGLAYANGATRPGSKTAAASGLSRAQATSAPDQNAPDRSASDPAPGPARPAGPHIVIAGVPRGVKAKAGILADARTGQVLWAKAANTERSIASITKVMTAYLVIKAGGLDRKIKIPKPVLNYVAKYGANSAGLVPGNTLTVDQLLQALLLASAADAAYTLSTTYGPGLSAFIAKMNAAARQLGLTHTHFTSPDGLPYPTETSTFSQAESDATGVRSTRRSSFSAPASPR